MLGVFIGEHDNKIDSKGRLSIPADFRRDLEEGDPRWEPGKLASMHILIGDETRDFLEVMTIDRMRRNAEKIFAMDAGRKRAKLENLYFTNATTATMDATGRIVLAAKFRDKLNLKGEARIAGKGQTFYIYNREQYDPNRMISLMAPEEDFDDRLDAAAYMPGDR